MSNSVLHTKRTAVIGIVLPVHNEELRISAALTALGSATEHPDALNRECRIAIVLDSCDDKTAQAVRLWRSPRFAEISDVIECRSANVGTARQMGCTALLSYWADLDPKSIWIATTDADSEVPVDWLAVQLSRHEAGYDLWAGRVAVRDWSPRNAATARQWSLRYADEVDPIHGANLGFNAGAYLDAGGFLPLRTGEDRALHLAVARQGASIYHDHLAPVVTSARRNGRAPMGFAHKLNSIESSEGHSNSIGCMLEPLAPRRAS
jgi:hypothetical protein